MMMVKILKMCFWSGIALVFIMVVKYGENMNKRNCIVKNKNVSWDFGDLQGAEIVSPMWDQHSLYLQYVMSPLG